MSAFRGLLLFGAVLGGLVVALRARHGRYSWSAELAVAAFSLGVALVRSLQGSPWDALIWLAIGSFWWRSAVRVRQGQR